MTTPTTLREESFEGAEGLREPLNDLLSQMQVRLSKLEARQEWATLGPLQVELPIDDYTTPGSGVDFAPPPGFTPGIVFVAALESLDAPGVPVINPVGAEFLVDDGRVRVVRLTTATATGFRYLLTLGVTRGT